MKRKDSILIRNKETSILKEFAEYAKNKGSNNSHMIYLSYTKLVYKTLGWKSGQRDYYSEEQLTLLCTMEMIISQTIRQMMAEDKPYKDFYKVTKEKLEQLLMIIQVQDIVSMNKNEYIEKIAS